MEIEKEILKKCLELNKSIHHEHSTEGKLNPGEYYCGKNSSGSYLVRGCGNLNYVVVSQPMSKKNLSRYLDVLLSVADKTTEKYKSKKYLSGYYKRKERDMHLKIDQAIQDRNSAQKDNYINKRLIKEYKKIASRQKRLIKDLDVLLSDISL